MIKQGVVQEKISDLTAMNQLPPLSTLPQWSRINTLDRGRYPKPFVKDKVTGGAEGRKEGEEEERDVDISELNPSQRIHHLERSIHFLRQQHQEVLKSLHDEIEVLKKENKDLHFKIVMSQKQHQEKQSANSQHDGSKDRSRNDGNSRALEKEYSSNSLISQTLELSSSAGRSRVEATKERLQAEDRLDELKIIFLEEEIKELKHALRDLKNRNNFLTQRLEQEEEHKKKQLAKIESLQYQVAQGGGPMAEKIATGNLNIFSNPNHPPTLTECEVVIRHLQSINEQQTHELERLKSDLRDVLYSHKWTPDAYLLAKAYIAEDDAKDKEEKRALPKLKNPSRKLPDIAYIQRDTVNLPALKQTVSNKAIERRKRTQILQKARLHKEILP
ncbi:coiled-coil domain-containing protein 74A-like isoform X1 [Pecten maximus]|uniref:coiled-coil domain-containing protein 74A-like isoform X1 n=1 Tax=Pecten maximus TaxID=6579 RepID=UPI001458FEB4|nr:coiled-coil domain-containing protein 74A-like isoform X1 [Pecten maximus]